MTLPVALPYGIRDCKLTRYTDASGSILAGASVDLPNMTTFSFSETEEFSELRGDDRLVATRGQGAQVEWELEAGGISFPAWSILTGGEVIESGITPNRKRIIRKKGSDSRPYFRSNGRAISDSGGDVHSVVYRCRVNDTVEGEFGDGEFFMTSASGLGLPMLDEEFDILYDFVQNETASPLTLVPAPNPLAPPSGLTVGTLLATSAVLSWLAVTGATSYALERSTDAGVTWASTTPATVAAPAVTITATGLTTATAYLVRVRALRGAETSPWSTSVAFTTP